jgi:hypothetical protein
MMRQSTSRTVSISSSERQDWRNWMVWEVMRERSFRGQRTEIRRKPVRFRCLNERARGR